MCHFVIYMKWTALTVPISIKTQFSRFQDFLYVFALNMVCLDTLFVCYLFCFVFSDLPGSVVWYFSLLLESSWPLLLQIFLLLHFFFSI